MKTVNRNVTIQASFQITKSNDYYVCRMYILGKEVGASDYVKDFKTEDAAIRSALNDFKSNY